MSFFGNVMSWLFNLFNQSFVIYGYSISFFKVFVFICIGSACAYAIGRIIN